MHEQSRYNSTHLGRFFPRVDGWVLDARGLTWGELEGEPSVFGGDTPRLKLKFLPAGVVMALVAGELRNAATATSSKARFTPSIVLAEHST